MSIRGTINAQHPDADQYRAIFGDTAPLKDGRVIKHGNVDMYELAMAELSVTQIEQLLQRLEWRLSVTPAQVIHTMARGRGICLSTAFVSQIRDDVRVAG